jgi:hypothetical protein
MQSTLRSARAAGLQCTAVSSSQSHRWQRGGLRCDRANFIDRVRQLGLQLTLVNIERKRVLIERKRVLNAPRAFWPARAASCRYLSHISSSNTFSNLRRPGFRTIGEPMLRWRVAAECDQKLMDVVSAQHALPSERRYQRSLFMIIARKSTMASSFRVLGSSPTP